MNLNPVSAIVDSASSLVSAVGNAIDANVTSDEERLSLKNQITQILSQSDIAFRQSATEFAKADMASDSWLSKNIRPMAMIAVVVIYTVMALIDGAGWIDIPDIYVSGFGQWGMMIMSFYFGGRTIEKAASFFRK